MLDIEPDTTILPSYEITINEDITTIITCEAVGYPPPTITWSGVLSGRVSVGGSTSVLTGTGNITRVSVKLTITNATREDTGVYMCSANNSIGNEDKTVSVVVQCKSTL